MVKGVELSNNKRVKMKTEEEILNSFIEVEVSEENQPKVRETLRRMGVLSKIRNELFQSCHLFSKAGKFYLVHFKEMYALNGQPSTFSESDKHRRDKIASLLVNWGFLTIVNPSVVGEIMKEKITVIPYREKNNYILTKKYRFDLKNSKYFVAPEYDNVEEE
jgi:hypothetical protein